MPISKSCIIETALSRHNAIFFQDTPKSDYIGLRTTYKEGVHQVYYVDAGVRSLNFDVVAKAYPNPTKDIFNISTSFVLSYSGICNTVFRSTIVS